MISQKSTGPSRARFRALGAPAGPDRPWDYFLAENLLQARQGSMFPTNGHGPDEDVNVYLIHLLARFLRGDSDSRVLIAGQPLLTPPSPASPRRARADFYRANADHRLLHLGLFDRGDGRRRRRELFGHSLAESRQRDLHTGRACYAAAANHLRPATPDGIALATVWRKLAADFDDYVHVLGVLATRHLGLGKSLNAVEMDRLIGRESAAPAADPDVDTLLAAPPPQAVIDALLDLWLANKKKPEPNAKARLRAMANQLGVQIPGH